MPKFGFDKQDLQGPVPIPPGIYEVRLDGFKPKKSKKGETVNLNPTLVIINHATENDKKVWYNCNTAYPPGLLDLCHCFGVRFENEDGENPQFPGDFQGPDNDPSQWSYIGPLVGQIGKLEIAEADNGKGGKKTAVKRFFCAVPGCTASHKESLL